jgi:Fe2+ or Zn2+ uptake regulation protein
MIQVERILRIAEIIASKYFGASRADIRRELAEVGDSVCDRTVYRYLKIFEDLGYIRLEVVYIQGRQATRYRASKSLPIALTGTRVLSGFGKENR